MVAKIKKALPKKLLDTSKATDEIICTKAAKTFADVTRTPSMDVTQPVLAVVTRGLAQAWLDPVPFCTAVDPRRTSSVACMPCDDSEGERGN